MTAIARERGSVGEYRDLTRKVLADRVRGARAEKFNLMRRGPKDQYVRHFF